MQDRHEKPDLSSRVRTHSQNSIVAARATADRKKVGAIVGLMADNACAWAAASMGGDVVTGSYTINFFAPVIGTRLRAKVSLVRAGKRQIIAKARVWAESDDGTDKLVAVA